MGVIGNIWNDLTGQGDTSPLTAEQQQADAAAKKFAAMQAALGATPYAINTAPADASRAQQEQAIQGLEAAANGTAPSAAELQLKQQATANNAAAFGAAAALKGRTPGASFTTATRQNAENELQTNATAAAQRAAEMASSRAALSGVIGTQEQQDQQAAQAAAQLKTNYAANQEQGQLQSLGQGITSAGDVVGANVKNSSNAATNITGDITKGAQAASMLSDEDEKKDIKSADKAELDRTFKALNSDTWEYKDPDQKGAAPGLRVGIMAQDMAKTPLGKETVIDGKPLKIDVGNALGLALAGLASMRKELDAIKSKGTR